MAALLEARSKARMRPGDAMDGAVQAAEGAVDMVTVSGVVLVNDLRPQTSGKHANA